MATLIWILVLLIPILIISAFIARRLEVNRFRAIESTVLSHRSKSLSPPITTDDIKKLPHPLYKYLERSGLIGKRPSYAVSLRQTGRFRIYPKQKWMPFKAMEVIDFKKRFLYWQTWMRPNPFFWVSGTDKLEEQKGNMRIFLYSLIPLANAKGPEIDQGARLRFLNELIWVPFSFTDPAISWEAINERKVIGRLKFGNDEIKAEFQFDKDFDLINFHAIRYMTVPGGFEKRKWSTPFSKYDHHSGIRMPVSGTGVWELDEGNIYPYVELQITDCKFAS